MNNKIRSKNELAKIVAKLKAQNKEIVFTNGCFDILHVGHVDYLDKARKLGDILVVGVNSDNSVRRLKGKDRPINNERDRAFVLSALASVDYVIIFNELTPEKIIKILKPTILVKGADWKIKDIVGASFVIANGGKVRRIPFVKGFSSTSVINKLKK